MHPVHLPRFLSLLVTLLATALHGASPADDVAAATEAWAEAYNSREPAHVLALYAPDAVFWGTVSPTLRTTPEEIAQYFANMPERPLARVAIGEHRIRVFGDTAINTGYYTFSNSRPDGSIEANASRFSFTYHRRDGKWWIVDHHSSRVPAPSS